KSVVFLCQTIVILQRGIVISIHGALRRSVVLIFSWRSNIRIAHTSLTHRPAAGRTSVWIVIGHDCCLTRVSPVSCQTGGALPLRPLHFMRCPLARVQFSSFPSPSGARRAIFVAEALRC